MHTFNCLKSAHLSGYSLIRYWSKKPGADMRGRANVCTLMCVLRCRRSWRRGSGSGRLKVTWATVSDGARCSQRAARSLRYPCWTNPAPKISRRPRRRLSPPAMSQRCEAQHTHSGRGRRPECATIPQSDCWMFKVPLNLVQIVHYERNTTLSTKLASVSLYSFEIFQRSFPLSGSPSY